MSGGKGALDKAYKKKSGFDQMASMHFKLSDRYLAWSKVEDAIEIIISVSLCGLTFFDFEKFFGALPINPTLIIGFVSIILLAFTLIKQRFDHKKLSEQHNLAGKMYAHAKLEIGAKINEWEIQNATDLEIVRYLQNNFSELNELPQIPEKDFIKLKHKHQAKVEFSKYLDTHKNDYLWVSKLKFRLGRQ